MTEKIIRHIDGVALVQNDDGYHIAVVVPGYRRDFSKTYKRLGNAENAWYDYLGEVHGVTGVRAGRCF